MVDDDGTAPVVNEDVDPALVDASATAEELTEHLQLLELQQSNNVPATNQILAADEEAFQKDVPGASLEEAMVSSKLYKPDEIGKDEEADEPLPFS